MLHYSLGFIPDVDLHLLKYENFFLIQVGFKFFFDSLTILHIVLPIFGVEDLELGYIVRLLLQL